MKKLLKSKKILIIVSIFIILGSAGGYYLYNYLQAPSVEVEHVKQGNLVDYITETTTVKAYNSLRISSQVNGIADRISFDIGEKVSKGDTLVTVTTTDIDFQVQSLYAQRQRLQSAYNQLTNPLESQIENAELEVKSLENQMMLAKEKYENSAKLHNEGALSKIAFEEIKNAYLSTTNTYQIALNNLELLKQGGNKYEKEQIQYQIKEIDLNISRLKNNKQNYNITAPYEGVITSMDINEGEIIVTGNPLGSMANLDNLYLYGEVLASKLDQLEEGSKVRIKEIPDLDMNDLTVSKVYPTALDKLSDLGIAQKRVGIEIALPQKTPLRVGSEIDIEIITREKENALYIPNEAIYSLQGKNYVMIAEEDRSKEVAIEIGWEVTDYTEVLSGLGKDNKVIVTNLSDLTDGGLIKTD